MSNPPITGTSGAAKSAFLLLILCAGAALIPAVGFLAIPFSLTALFVCFILSIVILAQGRVGEGVAVLFLSLIAPFFVVFAPVVVGAGTLGAAGVAAQRTSLRDAIFHPVQLASPTPAPAGTNYTVGKNAAGDYQVRALPGGVSYGQSVGGGYGPRSSAKGTPSSAGGDIKKDWGWNGSNPLDPPRRR